MISTSFVQSSLILPTIDVNHLFSHPQRSTHLYRYAGGKLASFPGYLWGKWVTAIVTIDLGGFCLHSCS